jgi:hypothetical protein
MMTSDIKDGDRKSKEHKHNFEIRQHFCVLSFALSFLTSNMIQSHI